MKIGAALLSNNTEELIAQVKQANVCDFIQFDVMDGSFTNNQTVWVDGLKKAITHCKVPVELHLMINDVEGKIDQFLELKVDTIIFHEEGCHNHKEVINKIKLAKKKVGMAIKPTTSATVLRHYIDKLDLVLILTVTPGKQGQEFQIVATKNIGIVRSYDSKITIELDGAITPEKARLCAPFGASQCVSGSYLQEHKYSKDILKQYRDA